MFFKCNCLPLIMNHLPVMIQICNNPFMYAIHTKRERSCFCYILLFPFASFRFQTQFIRTFRLRDDLIIANGSNTNSKVFFMEGDVFP